MTRAEEGLVAAIGQVPPVSTGWVEKLRRSAAERFARLGLPTTRMEEWRYTNLSSLSSLELVSADAHATLGQHGLLELAGPAQGHRLVFVNGRWRRELSTLQALPNGAYAGSLATVLAGRPEVVEPYLGQLAADEENAFGALNTAMLQDGALVYLPDGESLSEPLELLFLTVDGGRPVISHPRVLLVLGRESGLTVIESYRGLSVEPTLTVAVTEALVGEGARLDHYKLQAEAERAHHVGLLAVSQGRESHFSTHLTSAGAALSRHDVWAKLCGEGGEAHVNGLYLAGGDQLVDNHLLVEHLKPHCVSREVYKGILDGHARGVFGGRIRVHQDAQKTDAHQLNSNLLLSEGAEVDTKPQLEIFADDVKCGHGGTVGQLDEEAIFYLQSRGISREAARGILTYAFASELVQMVRPEPYRRRLAKLVSERLPRGAALREAA